MENLLKLSIFFFNFYQHFPLILFIIFSKITKNLFFFFLSFCRWIFPISWFPGPRVSFPPSISSSGPLSIPPLLRSRCCLASLALSLWSYPGLPRILLHTHCNTGIRRVSVLVFRHRISYMMMISLSNLVQHVSQVGVPCMEPHQHLALFPIQLIHTSNIFIVRSFQTYLAGPTFFTGFPFHVFTPFNSILYL